ncbi:hypothetical protein [Pseudophaeobacter profundi]|uniref:hypothetical protein n=1 Tax=Pseudophaeobacter profundi TaxID=3034152 RepID=UPI0024331127|nr:hypothetical protein [Pseudophaeobacter profundi]
MRNIRTWADIEAARAAGELTSAEEKLIDGCLTGTGCVLSDGTRPTAPSDARTIHADLLRYLITGGGDGCVVHDLGVQLAGAYVPEVLDLDYARAKGTTNLDHCYFEQNIYAQYCHFNTLSLQGSALQQGLTAQGAVIVGNVFLREGFSAKGRVAFNSAKIGGQLNCTGGQIEVTEGDALNAQGAQVTGNVFLIEGFLAKGRVDFAGAKITGQLACVGGRFHTEKGAALRLQDTQAAYFFWSDVTEISGGLDLTGAHFDSLVDDPESWERVNDLSLVGLTYTHITNPGDTAKRLEWLGKGDTGNGEFSPQPYTQLAKVLRDMGHDRDARAVLVEGEVRHRRSEWHEIEKRRAERWALRRFLKSSNQKNRDIYVESEASDQRKQLVDRFQRICLDAAKDHPNRPSDAQLELARAGLRLDLQWFNAKDKLRIWWLKAKSYGLNKLVGYGYKPFNSLWALVVLVLLAAGLSHMAWQRGDFAPNSDVILSTTEWQTLAEDETVSNPARKWSDKHGKGRDYETFYPLAYGFDVVVPIVNIGQEAAWAPSTTRGPWGWTLWWMRWLFTVFGWIVTALGAAAIAGVIRRE